MRLDFAIEDGSGIVHTYEGPAIEGAAALELDRKIWALLTAVGISDLMEEDGPRRFIALSRFLRHRPETESLFVSTFAGWTCDKVALTAGHLTETTNTLDRRGEAVSAMLRAWRMNGFFRVAVSPLPTVEEATPAP